MHTLEAKPRKKIIQSTVHDNSANVGSINELIGLKSLKVRTLKKQKQYIVVICIITLYFGWTLLAFFSCTSLQIYT